jgi:hypothetical protein
MVDAREAVAEAFSSVVISSIIFYIFFTSVRLSSYIIKILPRKFLIAVNRNLMNGVNKILWKTLRFLILDSEFFLFLNLISVSHRV